MRDNNANYLPALADILSTLPARRPQPSAPRDDASRADLERNLTHHVAAALDLLDALGQPHTPPQPRLHHNAQAAILVALTAISAAITLFLPDLATILSYYAPFAFFGLAPTALFLLRRHTLRRRNLSPAETPAANPARPIQQAQPLEYP